MAQLFVYGTLKRGERNNHLMAGGRFLGEFLTLPHYRVFDLGPYPGLVRSPEGQAVHGELWELEAGVVAKLDEFEGPDFARQLIEVAGRNGRIESYFYIAPIPEGRPSGSVWPLPDGEE